MRQKREAKYTRVPTRVEVFSKIKPGRVRVVGYPAPNTGRAMAASA